MNGKHIPLLTWKEEARFWSKVDVRRKDSCWLWRGALDHNGYGAINIRKEAVKAHRIAYKLAYGDSPGDLDIRHACDNPPCCNPYHLSTGTPADNMADCMSRGRHAFGQRVPNARLNDEQARIIYGMKGGAMKSGAVGRMFGVSDATIRNIWYRKTWKHIHD